MKIFVKLMLLLCLIFAGIFGWGWTEYQAVLIKPVVNQKQLFEIKKGDSVNQIITALQKQQIEINPHWFRLIAYQKKLARKLKAGEYELQHGLTIPELLTLFAKGKTRQYSITFPEGWAFKQIRQRLANNSDLKQTLVGLDDESIMAKLNASYKHPEGLFFPDTYFFDKNTSDFSVLERAYKKMQTILAQQWQQKESNLPLKTPYEALILASIIEKETAVVSERDLISGVFTRRLRLGMKLQTDPTIIYGMGDRYQGDIRYKDLREATAYNTYVIKALPPTPIAMPGKEAIYAALHPAKGNSLFFVARGDGTHIFSATLRAHNNAVNKYQRSKK